MIHTSTPGLLLDIAVLRRAGERLGVGGWPIVLDMDRSGEERPGGARSSSQHSAGGRAAAPAATVADAGDLFDGDEPLPVIDMIAHVLARPDRQLEARTFATDGGVRRMCLARRGGTHILAVRHGDMIDARAVDVTGPADLGRHLRDHVAAVSGDREPLAFNGISHPAHDLADRLGRCGSTHEVTDALHAVGASGADAAIVATALADIRSRTEIVAVAADELGAGITQSSGAIGIFDTDRGRILASASRSPDGRVWTTLSPGSGHRIVQATGLLIETLPDGRWF